VSEMLLIKDSRPANRGPLYGRVIGYRSRAGVPVIYERDLVDANDDTVPLEFVPGMIVQHWREDSEELFVVLDDGSLFPLPYRLSPVERKRPELESDAGDEVVQVALKAFFSDPDWPTRPVSAMKRALEAVS
jgi:hypothetical protein